MTERKRLGCIVQKIFFYRPGFFFSSRAVQILSNNLDQPKSEWAHKSFHPVVIKWALNCLIYSSSLITKAFEIAFWVALKIFPENETILTGCLHHFLARSLDIGSGGPTGTFLRTTSFCAHRSSSFGAWRTTRFRAFRTCHFHSMHRILDERLKWRVCWFI